LITTGRGVIGFVIPMLECVTPALVMFAEPIGISGSVGWLDYVLVPAMASVWRSPPTRSCCADAVHRRPIQIGRFLPGP
jgi:hypothetical protein